MPRGVHVGLVQSKAQINLAVENVVRWHIQAVRARRDGSISSVKHVMYGWMPISTYYQLQKLHELLPLALQLVEGGYRMKAALWSYEIPIEVLASGSGIPMAVVLIVVAFALVVADLAAGNTLYATIDLLALALPFGELWLLWRGMDILFGLIKGTAPTESNPLGPFGNGVFDVVLSLFGGGGLLLDVGLAEIVGGEISGWLSSSNPGGPLGSVGEKTVHDIKNPSGS